MPTDKDLFAEEDSMTAMSFGEHIEELRVRLILGLLGLMVGVLITFVPYLDLGKRVITKMEEPAKGALKKFYTERARTRADEADKAEEFTPVMAANIPAREFLDTLKRFVPKLELPTDEELEVRAAAARKELKARKAAAVKAVVPEPKTKTEREALAEKERKERAELAALRGVMNKTVTLPIRYAQSDSILLTSTTVEPRDALVSLAPLETMTIFFMVCVVTGLVVASPWVFYQVWAFVAAGLYRHERHYVKKFLPMSLGLFLGGVFLCFFGVLPVTLSFLLEFNVWLGIEPTLRLSDWMSFATILPLVFGLCFQTPLVMLFLERIGVLTAADFRAKRKIAILIIVIAGAVLTPGQDPFSQVLLAGPMIILYELGILLVGRQTPKVRAMSA